MTRTLPATGLRFAPSEVGLSLGRQNLDHNSTLQARHKVAAQRPGGKKPEGTGDRDGDGAELRLCSHVRCGRRETRWHEFRRIHALARFTYPTPAPASASLPSLAFRSEHPREWVVVGGRRWREATPFIPYRAKCSVAATELLPVQLEKLERGTPPATVSRCVPFTGTGADNLKGTVQMCQMTNHLNIGVSVSLLSYIGSHPSFPATMISVWFRDGWSKLYIVGFIIKYTLTLL
jgi:hypothetical protein